MINTSVKAEHLVGCRAALGEGPVWHDGEGALYWVDIKGPAIFRWRARDGAVDRWEPPFAVASLAPAAAGGFISGTARGFAHVDPAAGLYTPLVHPESERRGNRFNDGKLDRQGRFWAGTMDDAEQAATGALYRLGTDLRAIRVDDDYRITNGPAFDRAGRRMYHTDSARQTIFVFDLDADGTASGKRTFAQFGADEGYPDGMTVDSEDCLWVAIWGGACVRRLAPDGTKIGEITIPVPNVTSCTFGGAGLATLFITTARIGTDVARYPMAGDLFQAHPGVAGLADTPFVGEVVRQSD